MSLCSTDHGTVPLKVPAATSNIPDKYQQLRQPTATLFESTPLPQGPTPSMTLPRPVLPAYLKPLPARFGQDDITYLHNKGALAVPDGELRNELLRSYSEYVHPFMPLLDLHEFVRTIDQNSGGRTVSLLLFQAVMFTGTATVPMKLLKAAGYSTRREARRIFYNKTRLLYDLDYEDDSIALIQALLLMTYWREEQTGRKETHHWIEVAVSLAQRIGLHRKPDKKLWRRIWWSTYIRDAQIALGTRMPTRVKDVDFDVPMLNLTDFTLDTIPEGPCCIPADCKVMRDTDKQRQLAAMCIEMAKLCMCISHIISVQYAVTSAKGSKQTAIMLSLEAPGPSDNQIQASANALQRWKDNLSEAAWNIEPALHDLNSNSSLVVNHAFLHMIYYATLSSLYRIQWLPSGEEQVHAARSNVVASRAVRLAAANITTIATKLHNLDLVRYLPSPSITVLLPAIVIHLLDALAPGESLRYKSLVGFCKCMEIMAALRDMYAAADYSTAFLHAAVQKTAIGPLAPQLNEITNQHTVATRDQGLPDTEPSAHLGDASAVFGQSTQSTANQIINSTPQLDNGGDSGSELLTRNDNPIDHLNPYLIPTDSPVNWHANQEQLLNHMTRRSKDSIFVAADPENGLLSLDLNTPGIATSIEHLNNAGLEFNSTLALGAAERVFGAGQDEFGATQDDSNELSLNTDWLMGLGVRS